MISSSFTCARNHPGVCEGWRVERHPRDEVSSCISYQILGCVSDNRRVLIRDWLPLRQDVPVVGASFAR